MTATLTARDLMPLVIKLSHDEQVALAKLALRAAARGAAPDAEAYRQAPPTADEFKSDGDALGWDADGWDEFDAPR